MESLCREIRSYGDEDEVKNYKVDTVFFGGGTPSLLSPARMGMIFSALRDAFDLTEDAEITMEANPGTVTLDTLREYRFLGVNRLSLGVQSMDDSVLAYLGRIHRSRDAVSGFSAARQAGFDNINLDLMFGIPGQTMESFADTLRQIFLLEPEHLSFYSLQLEEGTPFYRWFREGQLIPAAEELDREMYHRLIQKLPEKGYVHYEISNASKAGRECRHNLKYWSMADYIGLGLAAHSYVGGVRFCNTSDLETYFQKAGSGLQIEEIHKNTRADSITDYLFTELRLLRGIDLEDFSGRFGEPLEALYPLEIKRFLEEGFLWKRGGRIGFTEKGLDFTNTVLRELMTKQE